MRSTCCGAKVAHPLSKWRFCTACGQPCEPVPSKPLTLGTKTVYGTVEAVGMQDGERFYMMLDKHGSVALMPADVMEADDEREVGE